jgi:3-hydroxyacyl-[acyl-carrier-protein] dehydratase
MRTLREEILANADTRVRPVEAGRGPEVTFRFGSDFTGFQGHFPGHPVLPAFVQLLTGECALSLYRARPWRLRRVLRSKFLRTVRPDEAVTVTWQEQARDDRLCCSFTLLANGEKAAVFSLEFAVEESRHA